MLLVKYVPITFSLSDSKIQSPPYSIFPVVLLEAPTMTPVFSCKTV